MARTATLPDDHQIGANNPPAPIVDPIDALTVHASDLRIEVGHWADGTKVENAAQAAVVERLINDVKDAIEAVELARDGEIKPLTAQVTLVREKYYPLVADTTKITGSLIKMKRALLEVKTDWGNRENARIAKEAAEARALAAKAAQEAAEKVRAAQGDIEASEIADAAVHDARAAQQAVKTVEAAKVTGMRARWVIAGFAPVTGPDGGEMAGEVALLRHMLNTNREGMIEAALKLAEIDVRAGRRTIPGLVIENRPVAV